MFLFCLVFAMSLCASVYMCFVVTCWERADFLALLCVRNFPIGILGHVWYLIVSIPDLCTLTYFVHEIQMRPWLFLWSNAETHSRHLGDSIVINFKYS